MNNDWSAATLNIRGNFLTRIFAINQYLSKHPFNLLVITESHFNGKLTSGFRIPSLPNFIHNPGGKKNSGGVSIFSSSPIHDHPSFLVHRINYICSIVHTPLGHRTILGVYHHPKAAGLLNVDQSLEQLMDNIESVLHHSRYPLIILGDFNLHHPHWNPRASPSPGAANFLSFLHNHNLFVVNTMFRSSYGIATHERGGVLDLIISNTPADFVSCQVHSNPVDSDHHLVAASLRHPLSPTPRHFTSALPNKWITSRADWKLFRESCNTQVADPIIIGPFNSTIRGNTHNPASVELLWGTFTNIILQSAQLAVPTIHPDRQFNSNWWKFDPLLPSLHSECRRKHTAYLRHRHFPDHEQFKVQYRIARHAFRDACRRAKRRSFTILASSIQQPNNQPNWEAFRRTAGKSTSANLSCVRDPSGEVPSSLAHSLDNMANFLEEVCTLNNVPPSADDAVINDYVLSGDRLNESSPFDDDISLDEVVLGCNRVNLTSAIGPDNISPHFLKHLPHSMHIMLWQLFNYSWLHSLLPQQWKQAHVVLIPKKDGDPSDPKSFRPISLTSLVVKMFERIIYNRIIRHMSPRISPRQAGFRRLHSTIDNLYHLTSIIRRRIRNKPPPSSFKNGANQARNKRIARGKLSTFHCSFIDLSKAFDRAWHNGVLFKLGTQFSITGRVWRWVRAFLHQRSFRVITGGVGSMWKAIVAGVPQGSVLAPLLFLVLINDIEQSSPSLHFLLYADDIVVYPKSDDDINCPSKNSRKSLLSGLQQLFLWCTKWKFCINGPKSALMAFHSYLSKYKWNPVVLTHPDDPSFTVTINHSSSYNYLGVLLRHDLKWRDHASTILSKARVMAHAIARVINDDSPNILVVRRLILSCLIPVISYALPIWTPSHSIGDRFNSCLTRPLLRVLGLPMNSLRLGVLTYSAIPDFQTILHQQTIRVCNRLSRRPLSHHTRPIWNAEHDAGHSMASPLSAIATSALRAILPSSASSALHVLSRLPMAYRTYLCYYPPARPPPYPPPRCHSLLRPIAMKAQYHRWLSVNGFRLLRDVHEITSDQHVPLHSFSIDPPCVVKLRARHRFDRTALNEPRSRHSDHPGLANVQCPLCNSASDTVDHYLLRCQHPRMIAARDTLRLLHHPIRRLSTVFDIPNNAIIVFLRHTTSSSSPRRHGCAAAINYPTLDMINNGCPPQRRYSLSAKGSSTDTRTFSIFNSALHTQSRDRSIGRWQFVSTSLLMPTRRTSATFSLMSSIVLALNALTDFIGSYHEPNDPLHPVFSTLPIVFVSESKRFCDTMTGFNTMFPPLEQHLTLSLLQLLQLFSFDGCRPISFLHEYESTFTWLTGILSRKGSIAPNPQCMDSISALCARLISDHQQRHPSYASHFINDVLTIKHILTPSLIHPPSSSISKYALNQLLRTTGSYLKLLNDIRSV